MDPDLKTYIRTNERKLTIEQIESLEWQLGFPSRTFFSIHIAGTNGKGSVAHKLARVLEASGKRVGLYTSPHISSYCERIQINRKWIDENELLRHVKKISDLISEPLSFFDLFTLAAFCYFAEQQVDYAVVEVGLGGRLDATNIIKPVLSVITSIDYDHTQILGKTLEEIAYEKAGIIKPHIPVVVGPEAKPFSLFERIAQKKGSLLYRVAAKGRHYEEENCAIVEEAVKHLPFNVSKEAFLTGIKAVPPCRFERVHPNAILDGGHNPAGLERTFERFSVEFPKSTPSVLAAFSNDKDIREMIRILEQHTDHIYFTQAKNEKAYPAHLLSSEAEPDAGLAFEKAFRHSCAANQILLVCGTFYIMDEIRSKLNLAPLGG